MTALPPSLSRDLESGRLTEQLAEIAEEASALILPYWRAGAAVTTKADDSPVTEADQKAEGLIVERLTALYAGVQTVAEEACAADGTPDAENAFFLIDPLDGTKAFVGEREAFTVNIALAHGERVLAGVISAPAMAQTWRTGGSGDKAGAFTRRFGETAWRQVRVRQKPDRGFALISHSLGEDEAERIAARFGCAEWQALDSSVKFCLIAEGRYDVYPRTGPTCEWDTGAGQAILEAAGGRVITLDQGQPLSYAKPNYLNPGFVALGG
ncbi:inositol monophosphatase family protein [Brevundimonas sp.]|uniref:3'(2'),5'-bisphosphate nucleotidase CysQ family protein n=1 Tax=Brevundimonas sp. TaxID=1871086 RepID=UPI0025C5AC24|nr:inositol monophosphatase family protein [Brevundimonas sp.]